MSGGNGPSTYGGTEPDCDSIMEETILNSPVGDVIRKLKIGDILPVELHRQGTIVSLVAKHKGEIAGSITSAIVGKIIECIQNGHNYVAQVQSIQGGACNVLIRPR